ncbi:glycosyltransferase [Echinimonas agarilytica]|uniref:Glycosyltransferase n=1 Tax=Echinimonas agarilytica TaxID=1215918 RepID=A0AA41W750_9GAMM|nr:glycosyltransferase [Echinimonas agarilytica]MCM2680119.1 glycosyltransferase [Echinimonas agarilytica]
MKVLYLTYENVFSTGILQAQVVENLKTLHDRFGVKYILTSTLKEGEQDSSIYIKNRISTENKIGHFTDTLEFKKGLRDSQSVFTFVLDIVPTMFKLLKRKDYDVIHARSYGAACIALVLSFFRRKPYIFDMRGILPEETVSVGKIHTSSFKFWLLKKAERMLVDKASKVFTVSDNFTNYVVSEFGKNVSDVFNISNPTNLNLYNPEGKAVDDRCVNFIYSGSCLGWHLPHQTLELFKYLYLKYSSNIHLYICTKDTDKFDAIARKVGLPISSYSIEQVAFEDMPAVYQKCHIGFCLREPGLLTSVSCPVKFGEYVASGIKVITNKGVSDFAKLFSSEPNLGVLLDDDFDNLEPLSELVDSMMTANYKKTQIKLDKFDWHEVSNEVYAIYTELER